MKMIATICDSRGIGFCNKIPWDFPEDLDFFKKKTIGKNVLMGSKTFESIGKPLPGRINWVLTRDPSQFRVKIPGTFFIKSENDIQESILKNVIVIGGEQVFKKMLGKVDTIYLTVLEEDFECDAFFPRTLGFDMCKETNTRVSKSGLKYKIMKFKKKSFYTVKNVMYGAAAVKNIFI